MFHSGLPQSSEDRGVVESEIPVILFFNNSRVMLSDFLFKKLYIQLMTQLVSKKLQPLSDCMSLQDIYFFNQTLNAGVVKSVTISRCTAVVHIQTNKAK